jgi:hypothetical protein
MLVATSFARLVPALAAALAVVTAASSPVQAGALENQALADRYAACWGFFNGSKWDEFAKCYSPTSVSTAPGLPDARGAAPIVEKHAKLFKTAVPDVTGEQRLTLIGGRLATTIALMRGTHTGPLATPGGTVPATGKRFGQLVAHAVESGSTALAQKEWFIQDGGTFLAQLGIAKQPARPVMDKATGEAAVVVATGSATEKANLAAAKKGYALFSKHDERILDLMSDDAIDHDQTAPADLTGKAAELEHLRGFWQLSSNVKVTTPVLYAAGDYTVAIGKMTGKNDGDVPAMGINKTGKTFAIDFIEVIRWKDGKTVEQWPFMNGMQLAGQLGLLPGTPAPKGHAQN